jgi:acyl-CoA dehydrogenase
MDFTADPNESDVRQAVRDLCAGFDGSYWRALEPDGYPEEFVRALAEHGWLGTLIPEEYGGAGLPLATAAVILEEIHASGCNAAACHAQMYTMGTLLRFGSDDQKRHYLPRIAAGSLRLQAFGITEPGAGSDTASIATTAERTENGYVIRGQKLWTSRASHSDLMLVLTRTTPASEVDRRTDGLSVFIIDLQQAQGITIRPLETMINHSTTEVFFDGVEVPHTALIGDLGKGFSYILASMNAERILIASECIGDGRWFLRKASAYASERIVFGRAIGQNQGVAFPLAQALAQLDAAALLCRNAAWLYDQDRPCGREANTAKLLASQASWAAANACLDTHGGFGFAREYDVERKFRETRLYSVAPISNNLVLAHLAHHGLGLPRSY